MNTNRKPSLPHSIGDVWIEQGGQTDQVVKLAERALDLSKGTLPGVSANSLVASVIAAFARTELRTVSDNVVVADELRRCASDRRRMFSAISSREDVTSIQRRPS